MKEKILSYLREKQAPASAQDLVREVLKIGQANADVSRRMIESLLESDPRFQLDTQGRWFLAPADNEGSAPGGSLSDTVWAIVCLSPMLNRQGQPDIASLAAMRARGDTIEAQAIVWTAAGRRQAAWELALPAEEADEFASDRERLTQWLRILEGAVWVSFDPRRDLARLNGKLQAEGLPIIDPVALSLRALTKKLFPGEAVRSLDEAATCLGLRWSDASQPDTQIRMTTELFLRLMELVEELGLATRSDLIAWQNRESDPVDWSRFQFDSLFLAGLPKQPGVYFFTDRAGRVIYVGKAKNLNSRVQSYFQSTGAEEEKKRMLREHAYNLTYEVVGSELEALLREARAIKDLRPVINTQLEINEREPTQNPQGNRIIILPSKEEAYAELFLVRQDKAFKQISVARDLSTMRSAGRRIKRFFFARKPTRPTGETWAAEILWRWLKKNREQVLTIDPDQITDPDECLRLLQRYLLEPVTVERVIHR